MTPLTQKQLYNGLSQLASDNPLMKSFLERNSSSQINVRHLDGKCAIFSLGDDPRHSLKYVVDPATERMITPPLDALVLQGLQSQRIVQGIPGVQELDSADFYEGVPGLLGRFVYLSGFNLAHPDPTVLLSSELVLQLYKEMDTTLEKVHERGIIHRDVKPGNLVYSGGGLHLIDWSLSASIKQDSQERHRFFTGTPGYMYFFGKRDRDYFALGVSFAVTLLPNIRPQDARIREEGDVRELESRLSTELLRAYDSSYSTYFRDLLHRNPCDLSLSSPAVLPTFREHSGGGSGGTLDHLME